MKKPLILLFFLLIFTPILHAQEMKGMGHGKKNLLYVNTEAQTVVPVNGVSLTFGFDVNTSSFEEASKMSDKIAGGIEERVRKLGFKNVAVIRGWDLVRQAKISIGAKGRNISNKVSVTIEGFKPEELFPLIAKVIDEGIAVDGAVALENVETYLTPDVEALKKNEVSQQAVKRLVAEAEQTALAMAMKVVAPQSIYAWSTEGGEPMQDAGGYEARPMLKSFVSVQKSFRVDAQIADQVKIVSHVSGAFEVAK